MGKRSRKRVSTGEQAPAGAQPRPGTSSRAQRDEARRRRREALAEGRPPPSRRGRPTIEERPPAPWGNFPLTELIILGALVLGIVGLVMWGDRGPVLIGAAAALGSLAGLELSVREHFAGYRSHSSLLAGSVAIAAMIATALIGGANGLTRALLLVIGGSVFALCFWLLREAFKRRSGGLSFR